MLREDLENSVGCKKVEHRNTTDNEKIPGTTEYRKTKYIGILCSYDEELKI